MGYPSYDLTFSRFARVNCERCAAWHGDSRPWTLSDWATATAGELGEACNIIKKLNRSQDGVSGNRGVTDEELHEHLGEELADTLTYLFLLADAAGVNLEAAVEHKFNAVSEKHGFPHRI